jgi:PBP1b-binding outer membrane lipoprotein LpoB
MNIRSIIFIVTLSFIATGCSSIPQAAIDVNKQISKGISVLGENGIEMINAWEQSAYNMLDEKWSKVYEKAATSYRSKKGIAAGTSLTAQQQEDIAGLSALIRDEVRSKIRAESNGMKSIITSNTKNTLAANESVTDLLASANAIATFQQAAIKEVGNLIPIPPAISTFISDSLKTAGL